MKVSIRIFDEDERKFLETILDLAARRLKISVEHVASGVAEVVFLKVDEPGASLLINASQVRRRPLVVVYGTEGYPWSLEQPATSKSLIELLGRLCRELGLEGSEAAAVFSAPVPGPLPARPVAEAPRGAGGMSVTLAPLLPVEQGGQYLERVREIAAGRSQWLCQLDGGFQVCIDAEAGRVFFPVEYSSRLAEVGRLSLGASDAQIHRVSTDTVQWQAARRGGSMPLEAYLWLLAQVAEPLMPDEGSAHLVHRFRLQRWPSFSRILHGSPHIVMSGRLMKRAMTLTELAEATGESLQSVMRFYNSACLCGLLQSTDHGVQRHPVLQGDTPVAEVAQLQEIRKGKAGIFSRVLKRLLG